MSVDRYKEMQKRISLMNDPEWVKSVNELKNDFQYDKTKKYFVTYKQDKQRNNRKFHFENVQYVEETDSFIFTSYVSDYVGNLTEKVKEKIVLLASEIITFEIKDKPNPSDFIFN